MTSVRLRKFLPVGAKAFRNISSKLTVTDSHASDEITYSRRVEHIADHAIALHLVEAAFGPASDDSASILPAVLEETETFAELSASRRVRRAIPQQQPDDAACSHDFWVIFISNDFGMNIVAEYAHIATRSDIGQ